jgi:hypothetical protein
MYAFACPGCIAANEENRNAFLFTTALLTFIPLIAIGGVARWLQGRAARLKDEAENAGEAFLKQR